MGDPIRVAIVDHDEGCRQAVCGWFDGAGDILIVGDAPGGPEMLRWLRGLQPDVVLIDMAAVSVAQVREVAAEARVIVLHTAGQESSVLEMLRAGALGHLDKREVRPSQAIAAVRAVHRGKAVLSPALAGRIVDEVVGRRRGKDK